ncbi:MAG: ribosome-binding factor A [Bacteroidetes bacterium CG12_big_fil_rev_8_21_14_0_65_60_17]|nr:MAG: ribosome-binding factor A [Bacteroidetes bacterium CG12_big_fil_rev_8_21_14_0_65_60_17]
MSKSIRTERVASLFQREIAKILSEGFADQLRPMVTVTGVRVTADLSIAYVDVSVLGESTAEKEAVLSRLRDLTSQIRGSLGRAIRHQVKSIPELRFFLDLSLEKSARMDEIFGRIKEERATRNQENDA